MNRAFDFVGTYTWGLIPYAGREPLWWILLAWTVILVWFFLRNLSKVDPRNIRGYNSWGPNRMAIRGFNTKTGTIIATFPEEEADRNAVVLGRVFLVALLIFGCMMIKTIGRLVLEEEPETIQIPSQVIVRIGEIATISHGPGFSGTVYTCTKTVQGPQFVARGRYSDYSSGNIIEESQGTLLKKETPTWWGTKKTFTEHKKIYNCRA